MKRKCIILYVNQGFVARYLLRTDILRTLRGGSVDLVILSHNGDEAVFRQTFESKNVFVEQFRVKACESYLRKRKLQVILINLRAFVLNGKFNTRTVDDFRHIFKAQKRWLKEDGFTGWIKGLLWDSAIRLLKSSKLLRKLLIFFECIVFSPNTHADLFERYSPDLVVVTALCGFKYNELVAREAHSYGVPVCCVILSWDNTSGMGMPGYSPDYVIAWTENMKRELIELNDIDERKIFVGGVAHFDTYYRKNTTLSRNDLCSRLGLDPNRKIIFYATKSPKRFPWGPELVAQLADFIEHDNTKDVPQLLVRIHPLHYRTLDSELIFKDILDHYGKIAEKYSSVILNIPETVSKQMDFDLADSETILVSSILKHSDVMLNMFSTMLIESSIFDLPAINVCIREKCRVDFGKSRQDIMVDYAQTHNQRLLKTGGVRTVFTMQALYNAINTYLDHPEIDSPGRRLIVQKEAGPFRGNAGRMIGSHILSIVACDL